ncbi:MAG: CPBP family intramembrane metalloprotease [Peptococcaceae bacterium]|nr:CPBP family intramembrane metalloprotease [Peptococcaceae bacterium]
MILKNKFGEVRSGWILTLLIVTDFFVMFLAISLSSLFENVFAQKWDDQMDYLILYPISIVTFLVLFHLIYKRPLEQMGLHRKGWLPQLLFGCLFGMVYIVLCEVVLLFTGVAYIKDLNWSHLTDLRILFGEYGLLAFILCGFTEEIIYRGFMMTALKTTRVKWLIVLLPAIIFSLMHFPEKPMGWMDLLLAGTLFAYLFIKTGRLWAPIGFHIMCNFCQALFGISVGDREVASLMTTVLTGPDWVTGGDDGSAGGISILVTLLCLLYVHFFVKKSKQPFWSMDSHMPLRRGMEG